MEQFWTPHPSTESVTTMYRKVTVQPFIDKRSKESMGQTLLQKRKERCKAVAEPVLTAACQ